MLFIPTAFDLIATVLMNVGLLSGGQIGTPTPRGKRACMRVGRCRRGHRPPVPLLTRLLARGVPPHRSPAHPAQPSPARPIPPLLPAPPPARAAVTASVYQMMRGAEMLFAALFAVVFLRRRWGGVGGDASAALCGGARCSIVALVGCCCCCQCDVLWLCGTCLVRCGRAVPAGGPALLGKQVCGARLLRLPLVLPPVLPVVLHACSLNRYHYGGIACCVTGIALVGVSSMLSGKLEPKQRQRKRRGTASRVVCCMRS